MKTTQFLTNIKTWKNAFVAFLFLFSFSINSQNVGDDLMAATNGQLDTSQVTGSGTGCAPCGWTATNGTNYAPSNTQHGNTHSGDRMWKMFANNGGNGEFVAQEFSQLPLGTYTLTFYHKWTNCGNLDYSNGGPQLSFKKSDGAGGWVNVNDPIEVPQSNCGASSDWTEMTVTYEITEVNDYRMQIYKNGANGLNASLHMDTFSLVYTAEASSGGVTAPWTDDFEDADITDWTILTAADASQGWVLANGTNGSLVMYHADDNVSSGVDNYLASPVIDMSGLTSPILSYSERGSYPTYYTFHGVYTSDDYTGDVAAATWTLLTEGVAPTTEAVQEFSIPNTTTGIAFRYQGDYSDTWEIDNVSVTDAPTEPAMEVAVSTNIDSATFSFTVENFTVGASGDAGVDGHIHYSLNGGSTVMVYSSDDLTLSDLPDGDHTIVFELVDEAHASLDPAVTQSVNFSTNNACGDTVTYTQVANGDYTVGASAAAGEVASVTVDADMETNYDYLYVRDGAGNLLNSDNTTGLIQATYESPDGVITVNVTNDGSVQNGDVTLTFTCAAAQSNVTFSVNMSNYPGGLGADDTVHLNGSFAGWCGDCIPMSDDDGDGIWTVTIPLDDGDYQYKFTVNGWSNQEQWPGDGTTSCAENADDGTYENRAFTVAGADMTLETVYWNLCIGEEPGETFTVTFQVNTSAIVGGVGANGIYAGGGILGNAQALQLTDDDGDGVWVGSIDLPEGTTGNYIFLNSPGDGGDWGTKENLEGQDCADPANYNDRILDPVTADTTILACFGYCSGDGTGECPSTGTTWQLTMTVNTANITVGDNGMYLGGGYFGGANAYAMSDDDGDGTWEVTVEVADGASGNYAFFNSPNASDDWGTKENIEGQACADPANYNDRILEAVTADTTLMHCFGSCETDGSCTVDECPAPEITSWTMTGDGAIFDGNNQEEVIGYQIEYSTSTFTPGDGTASVYEFDSFPHTLTGLESITTYYFTIRSVCGDDDYSDWTDNGNDGPDSWTTSICPSSYSLPYLNDFNDPDTWTSCQTFYDNDSDGQFWFYVNYTDIDGDGNNVAASASWTSGTGALTPDNWVIMGPIDLTNHTDALLEWKVRGIDPAWCQENYSVYVGSSNNYNDLIYGSVSYNETIADGGDACGNTFADRSLDISAATGGLVYIGFRHHDVTDMFILNVDDVSVTSSTMSNEEFTLENIDYMFNQESKILNVNSQEILSNIEIYNIL